VGTRLGKRGRIALGQKWTTQRDGKTVEISAQEALQELDDHARQLLGDERTDELIRESEQGR